MLPFLDNTLSVLWASSILKMVFWDHPKACTNCGMMQEGHNRSNCPQIECFRGYEHVSSSCRLPKHRMQLLSQMRPFKIKVSQAWAPSEISPTRTMPLHSTCPNRTPEKYQTPGFFAISRFQGSHQSLLPSTHESPPHHVVSPGPTRHHEGAMSVLSLLIYILKIKRRSYWLNGNRSQVK